MRLKTLLVKKTSGSILIMALWVLFFLSSLALLVGFYVRPQTSLALKLKNRAEAHYLAEAGVKRAMAEVAAKEDGEKFSALNDDWSADESYFKEVIIGNGLVSIQHPDAVGAANVSKVGLVDEERKININKASRDVLINILTLTTELPPASAEEIVGSIINWRGSELPPGGECPDNNYYRTQSPSYSCKAKDFEILEELLLVKGITRKIFDQLKDRLTVYSSGAVNINTADEKVLQSLGLSGQLTGKIVYFRKGLDGIEGTSDDHVFKSTETLAADLLKESELTQEEQDALTKTVTDGLVGVYSENFRGISVGTISSNEESTRIEFVVNRSREIKLWREE